MAKQKNRKTVHRNGSALQGENDGNKTPATVWINIRGTRRQGDSDGKLSTILDCMVKEGIIRDDSVRFVNPPIPTFEKAESPGIDILILEDE